VRAGKYISILLLVITTAVGCSAPPHGERAGRAAEALLDSIFEQFLNDCGCMLNSDFDPTATQPEPAMNPMENAPDLEALADLAEGLGYLIRGRAIPDVSEREYLLISMIERYEDLERQPFAFQRRPHETGYAPRPTEANRRIAAAFRLFAADPMNTTRAEDLRNFLTAAGPDAVRVLEGPVEIPAPGNLPARRPSAYGLYGKAPYSLAEQAACFRTLAILSLR